MLRSREQEKAKFAFECINNAKRPGEFQKKYKSHLKGAPALILTNGLGSAMAFINSKDDDAYKVLFGHLDKWLGKEVTSGKSVLDWITDNNTSAIQVHRATDEVLALLNWMKRFSDMELEG